MSEIMVTKQKAENRDIQLKMNTYKQLVNQTEKENIDLKKENKHLGELNNIFETRMKDSETKAEEISKEFNSKKNNFDRLDKIIDDKN